MHSCWIIKLFILAHSPFSFSNNFSLSKKRALPPFNIFVTNTLQVFIKAYQVPVTVALFHGILVTLGVQLRESLTE